MSGILGILNLDGQPVDALILQELTDSLAFRGPDGAGTWISGRVGLGHTRLSSTFDAARERQPCSLDGDVWITADARIDGRADLVEKLRSCGRVVDAAATDVELILHGYHVWADACVEHLLGDFAFAIWDGREQCLFCARDQFGVKPFYYARSKACFLFGNTFNSLRLHSAVSDALDESTVADFLLFGRNRDHSATFFADLRRLPPAHSLTVTVDAFRIRRYWTLSADDDLRLPRQEDYVERLLELLGMAVRDRIRTDRVCVMMTGGLDSSTLAAIACRQMAEAGVPASVRAFTMVFDELIPDQERHYSGLVAAALDIPVTFLASDRYPLFDLRDQPNFQGAEPSLGPFLGVQLDCLQQMAADSRVAITGWDGDSLFREHPLIYFRSLWKHRRVGRMIRDYWGFVRTSRGIPRLGFRTALKRRLGLVPPAPPRRMVPWLNPDFVRRHDLEGRWNSYLYQQEALDLHPRRPSAFLGFPSGNPEWASLFEGFDPSDTGLALEVRHPLLDLRLVEFLLAIPAIPWCVHKFLLRVAMKGLLPNDVLVRPKAPLAGFPEMEVLRRTPTLWDELDYASTLWEFIDRDRLPLLSQQTSPDELSINVRPLELNHWIRNSLGTKRIQKGP